MIDWYSVIVNSFWILGLSILLAAFSYHYWVAQEEGRGLKEQLNRSSFPRFFWISFVFVGVGLAGTSQRTWETIIWILFTLVSVVNVVLFARESSETNHNGQ